MADNGAGRELHPVDAEYEAIWRHGFTVGLWLATGLGIGVLGLLWGIGACR